MAVVYNYFEPIPIQDTENPKFESRICKTCSKPKRIEKGKTSNLITHLQSTSHLAVYGCPKWNKRKVKNKGAVAFGVWQWRRWWDRGNSWSVGQWKDITIIETEFDELCGEEELDNEITNLDNDLHVYKKKVVC